MKFIITRASGYEDSPWAGAIKETARRTEHQFSASTFFPKDWKASGYDHRIEGAYAARDVDAERWWINVDTLEELVAMIETAGHGLVVDRNKEYVDKPLEVTIYDGYLE